jgi:hypothetical protein
MQACVLRYVPFVGNKAHIVYDCEYNSKEDLDEYPHRD